jgi:uncharacterized protein
MKIIAELDWKHILQQLDATGYSVVPSVLSKQICEELKNLYAQNEIYRSTINMQRYRFGKGEYKYFSYPLPTIVQKLRATWYPPLSQLANEWMQRLSIDTRFPDNHNELIEKCHQKNQTRPTPLILRYETGGYNCLHQDLYGDVYFPFQIVFVLSEPKRDFDGGEFVLVEQLPRAQSKAEIVSLQQGDALIFTTNFRPMQGARGYYKAKMKHGISPLRTGVRYALGIIFHDAS